MKSNLNSDKLYKFIKTENPSLYHILTKENVVGEDNLKSEFRISVGDKGEQQLKSKLLDESSGLISKLTDYHFEIRENSTPLYSGWCSFESFSSEFDLHLISIEDNYFLISNTSYEDVHMELFDDLEDCLYSCSCFLSNHLDYIQLELSNYKENKEYYDDSESNGYGMSLGMEWNFPLPDYLFEKEINSKERLSEIQTIEEEIDSF